MKMYLYDSFNRKINYLRISVTDRCNYRCHYCMPPEGVKYIPHDKILRYEEILEFVRTAVLYGIEKIKITGGEPLVRKGIVNFISNLASIREIKDLSITTNGYYLEEYAEQLFKAGLKRLNISLDTLDPIKYKKITLYGDLSKVLKGIEIAEKIGFYPIKINSVIDENTEESEISDLKKFCADRNFQLRFIKKMDLKRGKFSVVINGEGGNCSLCNRLRLTSDGYLVPCLFSNIRINIRELSYDDCIKFAIRNKPEKGTNNQIISSFNVIGG